MSCSVVVCQLLPSAPAWPHPFTLQSTQKGFQIAKDPLRQQDLMRVVLVSAHRWVRTADSRGGQTDLTNTYFFHVLPVCLQPRQFCFDFDPTKRPDWRGHIRSAELWYICTDMVVKSRGLGRSLPTISFHPPEVWPISTITWSNSGHS